ncbi:MAG: phosphate/phosphite/phosphonate ABC transporter substrate-binding protein [Chloroflexi bacterium]|nr:phosphate/phosphite/phosphonate ABC transporter substrate-binding protein [Chloroflexota bacterium]
MTLQMTVSPDFAPDYIPGWYIFNTWLQKQLGEGIHLELYNNFADQREAIRNDQVDIIYANPFDASMLIREKGFKALVRPSNKHDEAVIVVNAQHPAMRVEDLPPESRLVFTSDPDVHLIGMIMLEPADLHMDNLQTKEVDSYVLVAKNLLRNEADIGFFLKEAFYDLSNFIREQLRILVESEISVVHHTLLVGPRLQGKREQIRELLLNMSADSKGQGVLESLGFQFWENVAEEDVEFMIDLMDTLVTPAS